MKKFTRSFHEHLIKVLKNPNEAAAYLSAVIEEGDMNLLLVALRDVAEAQGGMSRLSRRARMHRGNLYKMFSKKGNPSVHSVESVLNALGFRLAVVQNTSEKLKKAA